MYLTSYNSTPLSPQGIPSIYVSLGPEQYDAVPSVPQWLPHYEDPFPVFKSSQVSIYKVHAPISPPPVAPVAKPKAPGPVAQLPTLGDSLYLKFYNICKSNPTIRDIQDTLRNGKYRVPEFSSFLEGLFTTRKSKELRNIVIYLWTSDEAIPYNETHKKFYEILNDAIIHEWKKTLYICMPIIRVLNSILTEVKNPSKFTLWRASRMTLSEFTDLRVGHKRVGMYIACSESRQIAVEGVQKSRVLVKFRVPKNCLHVGHLAPKSEYPDELEWLIPPYSVVVIQDKYASPGGHGKPDFLIVNAKLCRDNKGQSLKLETVLL